VREEGERKKKKRGGEWKEAGPSSLFFLFREGEVKGGKGEGRDFHLSLLEGSGRARA